MDKKNIRKIIFFSLLFLLVIVLIIFASWTYRLYQKAQELVLIAKYAQDLLSEGFDPEKLEDVVTLGNRTVAITEEIRTEIGAIDPVLDLAKKIPGIGPYVENIEPGLDFISNLSNAGVILAEEGEAIIGGSAFNNDSNLAVAVAEYLEGKQERFLEAEQYLGAAESAKTEINIEYIPGQYKDEISLIDNVLANSPLLFNGLKIAPNLLGVEDSITYLMMVQNRDEMRASGGFITAFGLLQIKDGRILALKVEDSTIYDYVTELREPPFPMKEIMFANYLVARDANWSPDFPTSAHETREMFLLSTGYATDAVIAFDQQLIVDLLEFTGPIELAEEGLEVVNSANVESLMIAYKEAAIEEERREERKEFLTILAPKILKEIIANRDPDDLIRLARLIVDDIERGHLNFYFNDPEVQNLLSAANLDGAVRSGDGDYMMLVDSNIGIGKIDRFIERSLIYKVNLENIDAPEAQLIMNYKHTGEGDDPCLNGLSQVYTKYNLLPYDFTRCYWDYWRVLTADGTEIGKVIDDQIPDEYFREGTEWDQRPYIGSAENGTTVVSALLVVPQMGEKEIRVEIYPPPTVLKKMDDGSLIYKLRIQKQAGIKTLPVTLNVTPPDRYRLLNPTTEWNYDASQGTYVWQGELDRTTDFQLEFFLPE